MKKSIIKIGQKLSNESGDFEVTGFQVKENTLVVVREILWNNCGSKEYDYKLGEELYFTESEVKHCLHYDSGINYDKIELREYDDKFDTRRFVEQPSGRECIESNTYKVEWLKNLIKDAEKSGYEELVFKIYDNGNIAFSFDGEQIEFTETSEEYNVRKENDLPLLEWLTNNGIDVYDDFLVLIDDIEGGYAELDDYKKDPSVFDEEEIGFLRNDIEEWKEKIETYKSLYLKEYPKADWKKDIENVNEWWKEKERENQRHL